MLISAFGTIGILHLFGDVADEEPGVFIGLGEFLECFGGRWRGC
jgi:hypothetical protein